MKKTKQELEPIFYYSISCNESVILHKDYVSVIVSVVISYLWSEE